MLSFATCAHVPVHGGRGANGGGLVEVEGRVVWGGGYGGYRGVHMLDEVRSKWSRVADGGEAWGTLAVCGGRLVWVGGVGSKEVKELRGGRWSAMSDMLVGCIRSCVLSVSGGGMVVMEGAGMMFRCLMAGHRPGTEDHHFLSHVGTCQQWFMGTWSS